MRSRRDSLYFKNHGYQVTAFDASPELVKMSSKLIGQSVAILRFQDLAFTEEFDGIWACSSLLHVCRSEMERCVAQVNQGGETQWSALCSFKYGDGEGERNGRFFNNYDEHSFQLLLDKHPNLRLVSPWVSSDARPDRAGEKWLNVVVRRHGR